MRSYDVVVIGTGPAGQRAAIQAAKLGASVAAVERRAQVGGTVIHAGTIASKTLREAVLYLTGFRQRGIYGLGYRLRDEVTFDDLMFRLDHVVGRELAVMEEQLARNHVEVLHGRARFSGPHALTIEDGGAAAAIGADVVILAPGARPAHSPLVPIDGQWVVDSELLYERRGIPKSGIVIGAGVVGVEYASIFGALGIEVTLIDQRERVLEFVDGGILDALRTQMAKNGVTFELGQEIAAVTVEDGVVTAHGRSRSWEAEALLYAVGRVGNTEDLGLDVVGLEPDARGRLAVDDEFRTSAPHVYAAGDVIGFPALAATSMEQGRLAARYALGAPEEVHRGPLPLGIYAVPELSMVGATEEQLVAEAIPYEVGIGPYAETARGQIAGETQGHLKLLVHAESQELLGVHIIGEGATELVHVGQMMMGLGGRLDYLVDNVFNYPTLAETYKIAALDASNKLSGEEG